MPELPEVEVTRLSFSSRIDGATVTGVRIGKPLRWPLGVEPASLVRHRVGAVSRRGKYLWLPLIPPVPPLDSPSTGSPGLLLHLGMSGSLAFDEQAAFPLASTTISTWPPTAEPCA